MSAILVISIVVRFVALCWSLVLLKSSRDWRMCFLSILIACMTIRQILTLLETSQSPDLLFYWHTTELPGLMVSFMGLLLIYFLKKMLAEIGNTADELRKSESKHKETVNLLPQIVLETDTEGWLTFANFAGKEKFGYSGNDGQKVNILSFASPDDYERSKRNFQNIMLTGSKPDPSRYTLVDAHGETFPALIYSKAIIDRGVICGLRALLMDISELTQTEAKLQLSEAAFKEAQRIARIGNWEYDFIHNRSHCSAEVLSILQLSSEEFQADNQLCLGRVHADDKAALLDQIQNALREHSPLDISFRLQFDDAEISFVHLLGEFQNTDDGRLLRLLGTLQDITVSRKTEIELRNSEKKYRTLVEVSPYCIHQIDSKGNLLSMNNAGLKMLGLSHESEIRGRPYLDAVSAPEREHITALMHAAFQGEMSSFEFRTRNDRVVRSNFVPISGTDNKVDRLLGITQDITEDKQAEEALIRSETRFRAMFEQAAVGVALVDINLGKVLRINQFYCDLLGYPEDELLDVSFFHKITHEDDLIEERQIIEGLESGRFSEYSLDKRYIHKNGSIVWVDLTISAIKTSLHDEQPYYIVIVQDITERKLAEEELRKLSRGVEASSSCMIITDLEGYIEYVNPKFTDITGYSKEEALGQHLRILNSDMTAQSVFDELWRTATSGGVWKGEISNKKKDQSLFWARTAITGVRDSQNHITHFVLIKEDVTHEYELSERLSYQATHDALTDLVNRVEFERRADRLLNTIRQEPSEHALCYMDLDQFKVVNDTCGHSAGDEMLRQLSTLLKGAVRKRDTLARLGGDEFGVLMEHCSPDHAHRVASNLQKVIQEYQFIWEGHIFKVGVSIGLVSINEAFPGLSELLKQADAACYMAKDMGRNRIHVYHGDDASLALRHGEMQWVTRIYQALEQNRFCLFAQSIVPLDGSQNRHYELLLRMHDEEGKLIPPGAFLPAAERYNLIDQLDLWVIENAFRLLSEHPLFLRQTDFISINLSGQSLTKTGILDFITSSLAQSGIPARKICFEITETTAISNLSAASAFIATLSELGCRFALDDFGSGLSSFGYLKRLPVDYLKIDGMFVKDIVDDPIDHAMVKSINEIGHIMGMQTIAEFVENHAIKELLQKIGVNFAQGYGLGKPQAFDELLMHSNNVTNIRDVMK